MLELTENDFQRLSEHVKVHYGINLEKKKQLITGRLSNMIVGMGFSCFTEYVNHILSGNYPQDVTTMLNKLTTNYTYFMREESHFEYFCNTVLPELEMTCTNRTLSIWSAGCSSGEEPYTLSILLKEYFGSRSTLWDTRILATDLSVSALNAARAAQYSEESLKNIPPKWKQAYFVNTSTPGMYTLTNEIKSNVIFRDFNLMDPIRFKVNFNVIFCRNVMIYFDQPTKEALVQRFYNATTPGGHLFIGHSESLDRNANPYTYIMPAVYRK